MHLVFEFDAYKTIRRYGNSSDNFSGVADNDMQGFFLPPDVQSQLADYIHAIRLKRKQLTSAVAPILTSMSDLYKFGFGIVITFQICVSLRTFLNVTEFWLQLVACFDSNLKSNH